MTTSPWSRGTMVIMALVAISVVAFVPQARSAPLSDGATASGGVVPQSPNCSAGREEDEGCVPRGPGSPTRPGGLVLPPGIPSEDMPMVIWGRAKATLHVHDDNQDVTYTSKGYQHMPSPSNDWVYLFFIKRAVQDMPGNTQYILFPITDISTMEQTPLSMTWTVTGRVFDCTVEGEAAITILDYSDPIRDPTRPVYGYMNVVGPEGGDYHSVTVKAFDPDAWLTKTCPGNPPIVTKEPFKAGYLLHILWKKNTHEVGGTRFRGSRVMTRATCLTSSSCSRLARPFQTQHVRHSARRQAPAPAVATPGSGSY